MADEGLLPAACFSREEIRGCEPPFGIQCLQLLGTFFKLTDRISGCKDSTAMLESSPSNFIGCRAAVNEMRIMTWT